MGPEYALFRKELTLAPEYRSCDQKGVLLYLGSAPKAVFLNVLEVIRTFELSSLTLLGQEGLSDLRPGERSLDFVNDISNLYQNHKLVIASCGVSSLERMMLEVPSITTVVADN